MNESQKYEIYYTCPHGIFKLDWREPLEALNLTLEHPILKEILEDYVEWHDDGYTDGRCTDFAIVDPSKSNTVVFAFEGQESVQVDLSFVTRELDGDEEADLEDLKS